MDNLLVYFFNIKGIFSTDFQGNPSTPYSYTGSPPTNIATTNGTKVYRLSYNATVQVVLQDTRIIARKNHPIHLHGFNFFVVGKELGNFNLKTGPKNFNLVELVERNTSGVPSGGWVAIGFTTDNPDCYEDYGRRCSNIKREEDKGKWRGGGRFFLSHMDSC